MITPLRRRHRWMAPGAFAAAVLGLVAGTAVRRTEFITETRAAGAPAVPASVVLRGDGRVAVGVDSAQPEEVWVVPAGRLEAADLLVYLSTAQASDGTDTAEALPEDAVLLGAADPVLPSSFRLDEAPRDDSVVLLYSLGLARRIASLPLSTSSHSRDSQPKNSRDSQPKGER